MHLIIAIQWKYKGSIGGMSQRFVPIAMNLFDKGLPVKCLTTYSLLEHLNIPSDHPALLVIDDRNQRKLEVLKKYTSLLKMISARELESIHLAGGHKFFLPFIHLAKLKNIKLSCTFASRTLEMAAYNNSKAKKRWVRTLNLVDKIDVLNPGYKLKNWDKKISVSPCSFPSRLLNYHKEPSKRKENIAVFSGALVSTKNPLLACQIMRLAIDSKVLPSDYKLYIFGEGDLKYKIQALQLTTDYDFIEFGEQSDYFPILEKAKLFFSLQDYDNYPSQSLMEAMYFGANCICTADGDTKFLFIGTESNLILDSRSPECFTKQLELLNMNSFNESNYLNIKYNFTLDRFCSYFSRFLNLEVTL